MPYSDYTTICDALVVLMEPLIEVVIHDVDKNKIIYMNGKLSKRKVGNPSLLSDLSAETGLDSIQQITYPKINLDGRLIKSISILLEAKWLLCINCDISIFSKMQELSQMMLQKKSDDQPKHLFVNDWQENLHFSIHSYLQNNNLSYDYLTQKNKKAIVQYLFNLGAFNEKNAADYVAKVLKMGRATVFNYLRYWRQ